MLCLCLSEITPIMAWVWPEEVGQKNYPKSVSKATWPTPEEKMMSPAKSDNDVKKVFHLGKVLMKY